MSKNNSENKKVYSLVIRYLFLFIVGLNIWIFYNAFSSVTIYPVYWILSLFYSTILEGNTIIIQDSIRNISIEIIDACIAGAAYYLLLVLCLTIPLKLRKQIKIVLTTFLVFLFINILRILVFSFIAIYNTGLFEVMHMLFWYFISTLIVVFIWFFTVKNYKIKEMPVYDDFKYLFKCIKIGRKSKRRNKKSSKKLSKKSKNKRRKKK